MTAQYMPGPWKVGYDAHDVVAPSKRGGEAKVCDIRGWGYLTGKGDGALGLSPEEGLAVQRANASLIAAAPDLLDALKQAQRQLRTHDPEWPYMRAIRAALAKAEGR